MHELRGRLPEVPAQSFGGSAGREGPIARIGAGFGPLLAEVLYSELEFEYQVLLPAVLGIFTRRALIVTCGRRLARLRGDASDVPLDGEVV